MSPRSLLALTGQQTIQGVRPFEWVDPAGRWWRIPQQWTVIACNRFGPKVFSLAHRVSPVVTGPATPPRRRHRPVPWLPRQPCPRGRHAPQWRWPSRCRQPPTHLWCHSCTPLVSDVLSGSRWVDGDCSGRAGACGATLLLVLREPLRGVGADASRHSPGGRGVRRLYAVAEPACPVGRRPAPTHTGGGAAPRRPLGAGQGDAGRHPPLAAGRALAEARGPAPPLMARPPRSQELGSKPQQTAARHPTSRERAAQADGS